jgi:hypothetical protein
MSGQHYHERVKVWLSYDIRRNGALTLLTRAANRPTRRLGPPSATGGTPRSLGAHRSGGAKQYWSFRWPSASSEGSRAWPLRATTQAVRRPLPRVTAASRPGTAACHRVTAASRPVWPASRPDTPALTPIPPPRRTRAITRAATGRTRRQLPAAAATVAGTRVIHTAMPKRPPARHRPRSNPRPRLPLRRDLRCSPVRSAPWRKRRWAQPR